MLEVRRSDTDGGNLKGQWKKKDCGLGATRSPVFLSDGDSPSMLQPRVWHEVNIRDYHSGETFPSFLSNGIAGGRLPATA